MHRSIWKGRSPQKRNTNYLGGLAGQELDASRLPIVIHILLAAILFLWACDECETPAPAEPDSEPRGGETVAVAEDEPGVFDVVTCLELLEHVPDPSAIVVGRRDGDSVRYDHRIRPGIPFE